MTRCGAYADHVDHVRPWSWWPGLRPRTGSTSAWRRVRAYVLDRDGRRCQLPVDDAGDYDAAGDFEVAGLADDRLPTGAPLPVHPDDPANLRAACARHNLQRGNGRPAASPRRQLAGADWKW